VRLEGLGKLKNISDLIRIQVRAVPARSIVPHPPLCLILRNVGRADDFKCILGN
jgi:hypothetical protein